MTPISIKTYPEGEYTVIELIWYDSRMRKPASIKVGMDKADTLGLIERLRELVG